MHSFPLCMAIIASKDWQASSQRLIWTSLVPSTWQNKMDKNRWHRTGSESRALHSFRQTSTRWKTSQEAWKQQVWNGSSHSSTPLRMTKEMSQREPALAKTPCPSARSASPANLTNIQTNPNARLTQSSSILRTHPIARDSTREAVGALTPTKMHRLRFASRKRKSVRMLLLTWGIHQVRSL